jgi:iron only hydrogenase large subunit-like protein/uncharacterized Fe-S cluster-containing protein
MTDYHPIYTEKADCQDCYKCVRECPVKAIKIENQTARVIDKLCIHCGHCVSVCPAGAKKIRSDLDRAKQILQFKDRVLVSVAPSYIGEFSEISSAQLIAALKQLGFYGVSETALGAQEVSAHSADVLNRSDRAVLISSACPTVVEWIKKYHPELNEKVTAFLSPLLSHARLLKQTFGEDIGVVFIGPCISKKVEADTHPDLLDVALTFQTLRTWFEEEGITLDRVSPSEEDDFLLGHAEEGSLYPIEGGMVAGIKANCSVTDTEFMNISGISNIEQAMEDIETLDSEKSIFLELLGCEGGCVNGPMMLNPRQTIKKRHQILSHATYPVDSIPRSPQIDIHDDWTLPAVASEPVSDADIQEALRRTGKLTPKDELNCGSCGYNSCRDFARALLDGRAETSMCLSYMRKLAHNKANALIRTMPSGVVIVDSDLRIIECNRNFARLLGDDIEMVYDARPGLEGARLEKLTDFSREFKTVLVSGEDIEGKDIHSRDKNLYLSVFSIEKHQVVGGIVQDFDVPTVQKEQVIKRVEQVIRKNLETVQQIAYLLGENASETEVTLNSILDSFKDPSGSKTGTPT